MKITKTKTINRQALRYRFIDPRYRYYMEVPIFSRKIRIVGYDFFPDFRKLNKALEQDTFPLSMMNDVIWKLEGFTFATYLDLNRRYYHFSISKKSKKLLGIILPWGKYYYNRIPHGLMISGDVFQEK